MSDESRPGVHWGFWLIGALCLLASTAYAEDDPLFLSDDPLTLTLEFPMDTIVKDGDEKPVVDGVLKFADADGEEATIEMTLTTRGRSRLAYCRFPPLKVNIKKKQAKETLFSGQNKLKIVTHCRNGSTHERYLRQEYGIYKAYSALTDYSFRVRWLNITYKDSTGKRDDEVHDAFFIESGREVAERHERERVMQNRIPSENLDPVESSRYAVFQYLIANTDWSMLKGPGEEGCCHNGKILREPGTTRNWVVLPYDFDQAGLINTSYAIPAEALPIRSVRQRLYRGRCRHNEQLPETLELFNETRPEIERYLAPEELSSGARKKALNYVEDFYEVINDPGKQQRYLYEKCIGT